MINPPSDAHVLCRFFQIQDFEKVRKITQSTNTQNPTDFRDFASNDEIQEAIEEYFLQKKIFYERKSGIKKPNWCSHKITNKELAQSTLGIILGYPSRILTPKKDILFTDNVTSEWKEKGFYSEIFKQEVWEMEKVFNEIYTICKSQAKKVEDELQNKWWLHIWRIWYRLKCKNYVEAFHVFQEFSDAYLILDAIRSWKNPLIRNQTDINLEHFLEKYKK